MFKNDTSPYAALILRVSTGFLFLAHGLLKLLVFTPAGAVGYFQSLGLPGSVAYLIIAIEVVGGIALMLGLYTRYVALATVPVLLGAGVFGHGANGWMFSNQGGGWEYPIFWMFVMLAVVLLGDGKFALRTFSKAS